MKALAWVALTLITAVGGMGKFAGPDLRAPTSRLIANAESALKKDPRNAQLEVLLGRLYSLRFAQGEHELAVYRSQNAAGFEFSPIGGLHEAANASARQRLADWSASYGHYRRAERLDPRSFLASFGQGFMLEEALRYAGRLKIEGKVRPAKWIKEASIKAYRKAFSLAYLHENWQDRMMGFDLAVLDSGEALLRLLAKSKSAKTERADIERKLKEIRARNSPITPIIFPLDGSSDLKNLLGPEAKVTFDLAGDRQGKSWPWIMPTAAFLAYDLGGDGEIEDGRELFGSATFWMFFADGYAALRSLDADGDGWLAGKELRGVVLWQDVNSNGRSEAGEVKSAIADGIRAIRTCPDPWSTSTLQSLVGIIWGDGRTSPTFDWVAEPSWTSNSGMP